MPNRAISLKYRSLVDEALGRTKKSSIPLATDGEKKRIPVIEVVDLRDSTAGGDIVVDSPQPFGSPTGSYTLKKTFVRISRLVVLHTWEAVTLNYDNFGDGTADVNHWDLQQGLQLYYNETPLFDEKIVSTKDYMRYAFDTDAVIDTQGVTKKTYFTSRFSFHIFMGNTEGLDMTQHKLRVEVDTNSANSWAPDKYGDVFTWAFEGWRWDV